MGVDVVEVVNKLVEAISPWREFMPWGRLLDEFNVILKEAQ